MLAYIPYMDPMGKQLDLAKYGVSIWVSCDLTANVGGARLHSLSHMLHVSAEPKRGLVSRGLLMIDLHFFTCFFVIELYKGCWKHNT